MEFEVNRVRTFATYPRNAAISALLLAHNGFMYLDKGKQIACFSCRKTFNRLDCIDEILSEHAERSPTCPVVNHRKEETSAYTTLIFPQRLINFKKSERIGRIKSVPKGIQHQILNGTAICEVNGNTTTYKRFSFAEFSNKNCRSQRRYEKGHSVGDNISTSSTGVSSFHAETVDANSDQIAINSVPTTEIQSLRQPNTSHDSESATPAVQTDGKPANRSTISSDLSADGSAVQEANISNAGSITPMTPSVTSTINIGTSNQTPEPRPHTSSHSSSFASGPTYSDLGIITERPKRVEYAVKQRRLETFASWPRDHHLRPEELAEAGFYYAGYGDCSRCFFCGGGLRNWEDEDDVWVEHARWFPKCAYIRGKLGHNFIEVVLDLSKQFEQITLKMVTDRLNTPIILNNQESFIKRDPAVKSLIELGYSEKDVTEMATLLKEQGIPISADAILEKLKLEMKPKIKHSNVRNSESNPIDRPKHPRIGISELKETNNQLRQQTICKICLDQEVAVVFLPCGHLVSCTECATAMKDCPVCRTNVKGIVRALIT